MVIIQKIIIIIIIFDMHKENFWTQNIEFQYKVCNFSKKHKNY